MIEYQINGSFICDRCRNICEGNCHEILTHLNDGTTREGSEEYERNKDLIGRKSIIHCLGKYCDHPCQYQREEYTPFEQADGIQPLITAIKYLGNKVNELLTAKCTPTETLKEF